MKTLKLFAAPLAALLILAACKTAPSGDGIFAGIEAKARPSLDEALGKINGTAGLAGYKRVVFGKNGNLSETTVTEFYITVANPTEAKSAEVILYNGSDTGPQGTPVSFDNEIGFKDAGEYTLKELPVDTEKIFYLDGGGNEKKLPSSQLGAGFQILIFTPKTYHSWNHKSLGGKGEWEDNTAGARTQTNYIHKSGNTLYYIKVESMDSSGKVVLLDSPANPPKEAIYTQK